MKLGKIINYYIFHSIIENMVKEFIKKKNLNQDEEKEDNESDLELEEEYEEEEPGWIENMYLSKFHSKEKERVNQEDRDNNPEPFNDDY